MNYKFLLYTFIFLLVVPSCTGDFEEINTNPTSPAQVPGDFLFTESQWVMRQNAPNYSYWVWNILHLGNWMQHFGNQNAGFSMAHYLDRGQDSPNYWRANYQILSDMQRAQDEIAAQEEGDVARIKSALVEILTVEIWYYFTQMLGDIPYTEALQGVDNVQPVYTPQDEILRDLINRIDAAIANLSPSDIAAMGPADVWYNSDPDQWIKYANSLKLKMGLGIMNGDMASAQQTVTEAMQGPLLSSTADNAISPTNTAENFYPHPMWSLDRNAISDRPFLGETFVDMLLRLDDPRLPIIASPTARSVAAGGPLEYRGIVAAPDDAAYAEINANLDNYSTANADWFSGATSNYDKGLSRLTYAEVSFAKAEAALRGWGGSEADAQTFFEEGIRAAMTVRPFNDAGVTEDEINAYIAKNGTLSGSFEDKLEQIMEQKYIEYFMDHEFDAYLDWRRTGLPTLMQGLNQGETGGEIPRRFKYGDQEPVLNEANYNDAVSRLSGGDTYLSRVWSDGN